MCNDGAMNIARTQPDLSIFSPTLDDAATFDEHEELKSILLAGNAHFDSQAVAQISARSQCFPVYTASIGTRDPLAPALGKRGSIHRGARSLGSGGLRRWFSCKYLDICCKNRLASHPDPSAAHPRE